MSNRKFLTCDLPTLSSVGSHVAENAFVHELNPERRCPDPTDFLGEGPGPLRSWKLVIDLASCVRASPRTTLRVLAADS
jgi:hypothetical protein